MIFKKFISLGLVSAMLVINICCVFAENPKMSVSNQNYDDGYDIGNDLYNVFSQYSGYVYACCSVDMDNDGINEVIVRNYDNNDYNYDFYKKMDGLYKKMGSLYIQYDIYESDNGIIVESGGIGMHSYKNYYIQNNKLVEGNIISSYEGDYYSYNNYTVNGKNVSEADYNNKTNEILSNPLNFQNYKICNSQNYYEAYKIIIDEYINCSKELKDIYKNLDWDAKEQLDKKYPDVSFEYFMGEHKNESICYCLKDINNDNIPELFVASLVNLDSEFYNKYWTWGIYTFNNNIICSYESGMGNRWHCYLLNNNEIFMISSGGATYNSYSSCKLNGLLFECTELLNWFGEDIRYNRKIISEKEANSFIYEKTSNIADLNWNSIYDFANIQVMPYIKVILNGKTLTFEEPPYIENGTTRVPMRKIFESLGATVEYDTKTKTITARKASTVIELVTGSTTAKINGRSMTLVADVFNKNGSTMVPLRFVSEALGAEVLWDGETKTITINFAEDKADKEHLVNNPITGHSNVILTIYDNRNSILDGIMWTTANWADGAKHLINIEEEVPDVEQGKGVLASILANVPEIESEPVDTSKYTDISDLASDGASIVEDYFGTSTKETKLLKNSIEKLGDVIDWTAFSIEEIDFLLRDYKKNIQYFVLLQSNCNDEYVNAIIDDLMQDYTDKWYKTIIDVNEKISDEVVDKGIDAGAGFYTAGLYPVVKYSSELISTTTGLKSKTDALADFYQVCRMINPVDETLEKCLIKYKNGECSESDLQAVFELNKATKIYAYECIIKFGNLSDVDRSYVNIQDIKQYILKDGEIVYCGGAGGGSMGGR